MSLLFVRITENETDMTWYNLRSELDNINGDIFIFNSGEVIQRIELTKE